MKVARILHSRLEIRIDGEEGDGPEAERAARSLLPRIILSAVEWDRARPSRRRFIFFGPVDTKEIGPPPDPDERWTLEEIMKREG